jgi:hypothetical protein
VCGGEPFHIYSLLSDLLTKLIAMNVNMAELSIESEVLLLE